MISFSGWMRLLECPNLSCTLSAASRTTSGRFLCLKDSFVVGMSFFWGHEVSFRKHELEKQQSVLKQNCFAKSSCGLDVYYELPCKEVYLSSVNTKVISL